MEKTKKNTEFFWVAQGGQGKVMLYIPYKETCLTFSNTQWKLMMINLLSLQLPQQDQQHPKLMDLQSIPHFYYMIILNPNLVGRSKMQFKLEYMMLSITDEISMVAFKQLQSMNQTMCAMKGTTDGNWGDICVLAVGDLYQLPPVGESQYTCPHRLCTLWMVLLLIDGRKCSYMNWNKTWDRKIWSL